MTDAERLASVGSAPGGLCWYGDQLLVSLPREAHIAAFDASGRPAGIFRRFTGSVTAMASAADGRLYCCQPRSRRVVCIEPNGSATVPAERLEGRVHNHPAGIAVDAVGQVWISDPLQPGAPPGFFPFLEHASVLCLSPATDPPHLVRATWDTENPGQVAVDVERSLLYVTEGVTGGGTPHSELRVYPIEGSGRLGPSTVVASLRGEAASWATALTVLEGGLVLLAASGPDRDAAALYAISGSGELGERLALPGAAMGIAGDRDASRTLFVVTGDGLWRLALHG